MEISIDVSILLTWREWTQALANIPERLAQAGIVPHNIAIEQVTGACMPEHALVNEYLLSHDAPPAGEVYRVVVNATSAVPLHRAAREFINTLPAGTAWIGSAELGHTDLGLGTDYAWVAVE